MANKRMFSLEVVDSDRFYDLPFNSQLLYFHLGMKADVKGFVEPKKIARTIGLKIEDLKPLIEDNFVIPFSSGVVIITHWNVNNLTREDREAPTRYKEEYALLSSNNNEYVLLQENSGSCPAQNRIGKDRIGEVSIGEDRGEIETLPQIQEKKFSSREEIRQPLIEELSQKYNVPPDFVWDCWDSAQNWLDSRGERRKDYRAFLSNWVKKERASTLVKARGMSFKRGGVYDARDSK